MTATSEQQWADDSTRPLPELSGFFGWAPDDDPAPYPPPLSSRAAPTAVPAPAPARTAAPPIGTTITSPQRRKWIAPAALSLASVISIALVAFAFWPSQTPLPHDPSPATASPDNAPPPPEVTEDTERLLAAIPGSDMARDCRPIAHQVPALARVECTKIPIAVATHTLYPDPDSLNAALAQLIRDMQVQVCPGNYQSPGPWRRNAAPNVSAGTLVCGYRSAAPIIGWTTTSTGILSTVEPEDVTTTRLSDLYTWWSQNS